MTGSQRENPAAMRHPASDAVWPPRPLAPWRASEYQQGIEFARTMFLCQRDAGLPASQIAARTQAAMLSLRAAIRNHSESEFLRGYADSSARQVATFCEIAPLPAPGAWSETRYDPSHMSGPWTVPSQAERRR